MHAYTSPIKSYKISSSQQPLSFNVSKITAEFLRSRKEIVIFVDLKLLSGRKSFNQVWQEGPVGDAAPQMHGRDSANLRAVGTNNFSTGKISSHGGVIPGVLNTQAWEILLPLGIISARYLKVFADLAWFYLHQLCQCSGYVIGVAGWGTGLNLGNDSPGIVHHKHRSVGIALFVFGTF
ncbi:cytochrome b561 and DOMON domain-containing protein At5g35735-like [Apium graveolens]|uniref:cytochrome b561 and DOMON domain-containing protein At5g35735-like n=1 Tax=Apium graveolens TaxID=4045 RepID=UPI003D7A6E51